VPARLYDSRPGYPTVDGLESGDGPLPPYPGSLALVIVAGRGGLPQGPVIVNGQPAGVQGVLLNVTITNPSAAGFATVFPCSLPLPGQPTGLPIPPTASNLNFAAGQTIANSVFVGLQQGTVCVASNVTVDLIVDVNAYILKPPDIFPLPPARLMDSRPGSPTVDGLFSGFGQRAAGQITELKVTGRGGVPDDATAVALNVTVTGTATPGFVTVFPCGSALPTASNLNYGLNTTIPNAVIAKVGIGGKVCFYTHTPTDILADVNGYFTG